MIPKRHVLPKALTTHAAAEGAHYSHASVPRAEVPEDLVGAVMFLALEASAFVAGQSINLDDGVTGS